jgi:hypothetical protein
MVPGPATAPEIIPSTDGLRARLVNTPELREQRNAVVLYVFGL